MFNTALLANALALPLGGLGKEYALIAGVGLLVMIAMLTSCAGIWLEVLN